MQPWWLGTVGHDETGDGFHCKSSVQTLPEGSALCSLAEGDQSRSDEEGMQKTKATQRQRKSKAAKQKHVDETELQKEKSKNSKHACISTELHIVTLHTDIFSLNQEEGTKWTLSVFLLDLRDCQRAKKRMLMEVVLHKNSNDVSLSKFTGCARNNYHFFWGACKKMALPWLVKAINTLLQRSSGLQSVSEAHLFCNFISEIRKT